MNPWRVYIVFWYGHIYCCDDGKLGGNQNTKVDMHVDKKHTSFINKELLMKNEWEILFPWQPSFYCNWLSLIWWTIHYFCWQWPWCWTALFRLNLYHNLHEFLFKHPFSFQTHTKTISLCQVYISPSRIYFKK